jgi:hypothetical protein
MRSRRAFITLLGGAAAWPLAARAQQPERVRRIGVLMHLDADDQEGEDRISAFRQELQQLGWIDGRNMQIDIRWGGNDADRRKYAAEFRLLRCCGQGCPPSANEPQTAHQSVVSSLRCMGMTPVGGSHGNPYR